MSGLKYTRKPQETWFFHIRKPTPALRQPTKVQHKWPIVATDSENLNPPCCDSEHENRLWRRRRRASVAMALPWVRALQRLAGTVLRCPLESQRRTRCGEHRGGIELMLENERVRGTPWKCFDPLFHDLRPYSFSSLAPLFPFAY